MEEALEFLMDKRVRASAGIDKKNPYLFADKGKCSLFEKGKIRKNKKKGKLLIFLFVWLYFNFYQHYAVCIIRISNDTWNDTR